MGAQKQLDFPSGLAASSQVASATSHIPHTVHMAPTVRDVARAAGVSVGTVSKALNGVEGLRQETRDRVHLAAEQLGYRPNELFQSVLRGRSLTVGLISTDTYGRFSMPLLEGIEHAIAAAGMSVFLASAANDPERERRHVEAMLAKRVDGLIVTASHTDPRPPIDIGNTQVPVLYAYTQVNAPNTMCLLPDDALGGRLVAEHMLEAGRRTIAHVGGRKDFQATRLRLQGVEQALSEAGIDLPAPRSLFGAYQESWGRQAAARLLERDSRVDAVICGSDEIAWGVINALTACGVRVPDDVAVSGYDNWRTVCDALTPPLTSVDMGLEELGRQAGLRLLQMIAGQADPQLQRLPPQLVVRQSTGLATTQIER